MFQRHRGRREARKEIGRNLTYGNLVAIENTISKLETKLEHARNHQLPGIEAETLGQLGIALEAQGDREKALTRYEEALARRSDLKRDQLAIHAVRAGRLLMGLGRSDEAQEMWRVALASGRVKRGSELCTLLAGIAALSVRFGDLDTARRHLSEAMTEAKRDKNPILIAEVNEAARTHLPDDDHLRARLCAFEWPGRPGPRRLLRRLGARVAQQRMMFGIDHLSRGTKSGYFFDKRRHDRVIDLARQAGDGLSWHYSTNEMASTSIEAERWQDAKRYLQDLLTCQRSWWGHCKAETMLSLAKVQLELGEGEEVREMLQRAVTTAEENGQDDLLQEAKAFMEQRTEAGADET